MEYGRNGLVDPRIVAQKQVVTLEEVVAWLEAQPNYMHINKLDVMGYIQRVTIPKDLKEDDYDVDRNSSDETNPRPQRRHNSFILWQESMRWINFIGIKFFF